MNIMSLRRIRLFGIFAGSIILLLVIVAPTRTLAKPRPPLPPVPELVARLWHEGFDWPYNGLITNAQISTARGELIESWSGFALQRSGQVPPFVVPAGSKARTNIACEAGAIRFWFRPYWSSGVGPGTDARLLTLVTLTPQEILEACLFRSTPMVR